MGVTVQSVCVWSQFPNSSSILCCAVWEDLHAFQMKRTGAQSVGLMAEGGTRTPNLWDQHSNTADKRGWSRAVCPLSLCSSSLWDSQVRWTFRAGITSKQQATSNKYKGGRKAWTPPPNDPSFDFSKRGITDEQSVGLIAQHCSLCQVCCAGPPLQDSPPPKSWICWPKRATSSLCPVGVGVMTASSYEQQMNK